MNDALKLFGDLGITYIPSREARRRGPRSTHCGNVVHRLIRRHGIKHATAVLRSIIETGNENELLADTIGAISDLRLAHPRWAGLGMEQWLRAFNTISLADVRRAAKSANVQPLRNAIMTLLCIRLEEILGPSRPPKQPEAPKAKCEPKPPRSLTRIAGVEANVELGRKLAALRAEHMSNCAYGRLVRARFGMNSQHAVECARAARAYGDRPDIYRRLSWDALLMLSSAMPTQVRQGIEARILAGERIGAPQIRRARQAQADRQQPDRSARIAA